MPFSNEELVPIYEARNGTIIGVARGNKSVYDFRVKYRERGKRERTPKHMHIIIDLYLKSAGNESLTMKLVDHLIGNIIKKVNPAASYPPKLQVFELAVADKFVELNRYGEYPVDFLLVAIELIQIQEKTNYPNGVINLNLFAKFREKADIFSVVSAATFRGNA